MTEPKLKPCPFCGGEAVMHEMATDDWCVWCLECLCGMYGFNTEQEAIETWNKRVPQEENQDWFRSLPTKDKEKLFKYISEKCLKCGEQK